MSNRPANVTQAAIARALRAVLLAAAIWLPLVPVKREWTTGAGSRPYRFVPAKRRQS